MDEKYFQRIVISLLYVTHTRQDIMFFISMMSKLMDFPSSHHLGAAKKIFKYTFAAIDLGIHYQKAQGLNLVRYLDGDWVG